MRVVDLFTLKVAFAFADPVLFQLHDILCFLYLCRSELQLVGEAVTSCKSVTRTIARISSY